MIVTTFETMVVAESFFKYHFNFAYLIVDEAHRIVRKEYETQQTINGGVNETGSV